MPGASPPLVSTPSAVAGTDVIATHPCTPGIADALRPFEQRRGRAGSCWQPPEPGCAVMSRLKASRGMTSDELSGCVIVSGMPGAGKSTVTALAARLLPRAAQVKGDDVNQMILSGRVWFMGKPRQRHCGRMSFATATCARWPTTSSTSALPCSWTPSSRTERSWTSCSHCCRRDRCGSSPSRRGGGLPAPKRDARPRDERFEFDGYDRLEADMQRDSATSDGGSTPPLTPAKPLSSSSAKPPIVPPSYAEVRQARPERRHGASPTDHNSYGATSAAQIRLTLVPRSAREDSFAGRPTRQIGRRWRCGLTGPSGTQPDPDRQLITGGRTHGHTGGRRVRRSAKPTPRVSHRRPSPPPRT